MPARGMPLLIGSCAFALACATAPVAHAGSPAPADTAWSGAQDVAVYALGMIGVGYKLGGDTPEGGLDCSGLVRHVFREVAGLRLPRTSKEMSTIGTRVTPAELQPGDLVFFDTRKYAYSHVGIYLGDNRFVHAPSRGGDVRIAHLSHAYWRKHYNGARRLVGATRALKPNAEITADARPATLLSTRSRIIDVADATP